MLADGLSQVGPGVIVRRIESLHEVNDLVMLAAVLGRVSDGGDVHDDGLVHDFRAFQQQRHDDFPSHGVPHDGRFLGKMQIPDKLDEVVAHRLVIHRGGMWRLSMIASVG